MSINKEKGTAKQEEGAKGGCLISKGGVLMQQIMSVLKLRLSIVNLILSEGEMLKNIIDYLSRTDINYITIDFVNKTVEELFELFINEAKQASASSSIDTTLSSITFNPSNKNVNWNLKPISPKKHLKTGSNKPSKPKPVNKNPLPMKFSKDKECSITEPVFFLDYPKASKLHKSLIHDIDIESMRNRIIDQIMSKAPSS